jgi:hypothetical protein
MIVAMADLLSVLASILIIDGASKRVVDVYSKHVTHANNARIEMQTIIEDIRDINRVIKKVPGLWMWLLYSYDFFKRVLT